MENNTAKVNLSDRYLKFLNKRKLTPARMREKYKDFIQCMKNNQDAQSEQK